MAGQEERARQSNSSGSRRRWSRPRQGHRGNKLGRETLMCNFRKGKGESLMLRLFHRNEEQWQLQWARVASQVMGEGCSLDGGGPSKTELPKWRVEAKQEPVASPKSVARPLRGNLNRSTAANQQPTTRKCPTLYGPSSPKAPA